MRCRIVAEEGDFVARLKRVFLRAPYQDTSLIVYISFPSKYMFKVEFLEKNCLGLFLFNYKLKLLCYIVVCIY